MAEKLKNYLIVLVLSLLKLAQVCMTELGVVIFQLPLHQRITSDHLAGLNVE